MSADALPPRSSLGTTLQIVPVVFFTFLCYLTIGLPLAVLPGYVHDDLGLSTILAGAVISAQYVATLSSRALAGRLADTLGPKRTVSDRPARVRRERRPAAARAAGADTGRR